VADPVVDDAWLADGGVPAGPPSSCELRDGQIYRWTA